MINGRHHDAVGRYGYRLVKARVRIFLLGITVAEICFLMAMIDGINHRCPCKVFSFFIVLTAAFASHSTPKVSSSPTGTTARQRSLQPRLRRHSCRHLHILVQRHKHTAISFLHASKKIRRGTQSTDEASRFVFSSSVVVAISIQTSNRSPSIHPP